MIRCMQDITSCDIKQYLIVINTVIVIVCFYEIRKIIGNDSEMVMYETESTIIKSLSYHHYFFLSIVIMARKPIIIPQEDEIIIQEGDKLEMKCRGEGTLHFSTPEYFWEDETVIAIRVQTQIFSNRQIYIFKVPYAW